MKRNDKVMTQARINPQPIDDHYCDLGNAIVLRALKDYVQGEPYVGKDSSKLTHGQQLQLRRFASAKRFLESDELAIFTKMPPEYLIEVSRQSERMYFG